MQAISGHNTKPTVLVVNHDNRLKNGRSRSEWKLPPGGGQIGRQRQTNWWSSAADGAQARKDGVGEDAEHAELKGGAVNPMARILDPQSLSDCRALPDADGRRRHSLVRMPVDLFPPIKIPVVVVATFFSGMPPEQIEADITGRFERFFTLASSIEHIESRSLPGVSLIKVYFQPGTDADSAVTNISNLAMANLRRLPPGTLPPVVLKFDASSLPVCLITLKGKD